MTPLTNSDGVLQFILKQNLRMESWKLSQESKNLKTKDADIQPKKTEKTLALSLRRIKLKKMIFELL